tara:strand:- start:3269 stop:5179 length:1911 start_codon:yes stop_codon:yes gene_type:complete
MTMIGSDGTSGDSLSGINLQLRLHQPEIIGSRVEFRFDTSHIFSLFRNNKFWFEYPGLEPEDFVMDDLYNIGIGMLTSQLANLSCPSTLHIDQPIKKGVKLFWTKYHNCEHVEIKSPEQASDNPEKFYEQRKSKSRLTLGNKIALLFGGGKDSLSIASILQDVGLSFGLISLTNPNFGSHSNLEKRREENSFMSIAESQGIEIERIRTNIYIQLRQNMHTELYTACSVPILRKKGYDSLLFSYEVCHYYTHMDNSIPRIARFRKSRPETNMLVSSHYRENLNLECNVLNLNYPISEYGAYLILQRRYPDMLPHLLMCESTNERDKKWCLNCTKCAEHVLFNLSVNQKPEIDPNHFFENGPWFVNKIKPKLENMKKGISGNWFPGLTFHGHIDSFQHVISKINPTIFSSEEARMNFVRFKTVFSMENQKEEHFIQPLANRIQSTNAELVFSKMKEILEIGDSVPQKYWGVNPVSYDLEFNVFDKEDFESFELQSNEKKIGLAMNEEAIPTEQSNLSAQGLNQINHFTMGGHSCLSGKLDPKVQTEVRFSKTFKSLIVGKKINKLSLSFFTNQAPDKVEIHSPGTNSSPNSIKAGWNNIDLNLVEDQETQRVELTISISAQDGALNILVGNFSVFHSE